MCNWNVNTALNLNHLTHRSTLWQAPIKNGDVQRRNLCTPKASRNAVRSCKISSMSWAHINSQTGNSMISLIRLIWGLPLENTGKTLVLFCNNRFKWKFFFAIRWNISFNMTKSSGFPWAIYCSAQYLHNRISAWLQFQNLNFPQVT